MPANNMITFYHDTEQNFGIKVNAETCRQIVAEFIRIENEYGISSCYNVVGKIYREQPELIEQITHEGNEVAFHSYNHKYDPNDYVHEIARCREISSSIKGYRSPRSQWNESTLQALWQSGFSWTAENDSAREPYFIYKGLVRLPIAADDWKVHLNQMCEEEWVQSFVALMENNRYFGFGNHDAVVSLKPELRLKAYEKVIQIALQKKALIVNFSEAADLFRRAADAKFYGGAADGWLRTNLHQQDKHSQLPVRMRQIPLSEFRFEFRNRERDAYVRSFGKYVPAPVRKIIRRLPYFKGL